MTPTIRTLFSACMAIIAASCATASEKQESDRFLDGATLVSFRAPALRITPAIGFTYVGETKTIIKQMAQAERHHWVIKDGGKVRALLIAQFEGFLDDVSGRYQYAAPTTEEGGSNFLFTTGPLALGGVDFVHNTWALDFVENAKENPGTEAPATLALLESEGLNIDEAVIMSRFVRALGPDDRKEFIVFYLEPLSALGRSLSEFADGGELTEAYRDLSVEITARSLASFRLDYESD
jgi:hypothetical protein